LESQILKAHSLKWAFFISGLDTGCDKLKQQFHQVFIKQHNKIDQSNALVYFLNSVFNQASS